MGKLIISKKKYRMMKRITALILTFVMVCTSIGLENFARKAKAATAYTTLYLQDDTGESWIGNDNAVIELVDNTYGHDRYIMTKVNDNLWSCKVPSYTYNVTFNRLSPDKKTQWNSWSAGGRDNHSTYHATVPEHGYWDGVAQIEECFKEGDIVYLDLYEFKDWENASAKFYVNFTEASKADNNNQDIDISSADRDKYSPILLTDEIEEQVYKYVVTAEDEGATELRFWRGSTGKLWNSSVTLSYSDYKAGNNCAKIKGWNDTGYVCPYVPRRHITQINSINAEVSGNRKINRKIGIELKVTGETELLLKENTIINITKIDGNGNEILQEAGEVYYVYDETAGEWNYRELIFKQPGTYKISGIATDGYDSFSAENTIVIADDKNPQALFEIQAGEDETTPTENVFVRDGKGKTHITITDKSASETGDDITSRTYKIYYDADMNGVYEESEIIDTAEGNELSTYYETDKVGKYKITLDIKETFSDTIMSLVNDEDYLTGYYEKEIEIVNQAPTSAMTMEKSKIADIIFTVGNADSETLAAYAEATETVKNRLMEMGIDANVSTVSTSALTAKDTFAWKEFDHYDFADLYGQTLPQHIIYQDKDIKMLGYFKDKFKDFLYVPDTDDNRKVFEFDLQRDGTDWHSMEGGGFLFNTVVSEEENYIQGYCILVTSEGLKLIQINRSELASFRNGLYENVQYHGRLLRTFSIGDVYANHHFKIIVDGNIITVYDGNSVVINEYALPDDGVKAYGYGPIISHISHWCPQQSYFTFKNIKMQTVTGQSLSDVVNNHEWTPGNNHYVINLSDTSVPELSDNDRMSDVAAAMISNDVMFFGVGNDTTLNEYNSLLNTMEGKGENIKYKKESEEASADGITVDEAVNQIVSRITTDIEAKDYSVLYTIATDEEMVYKGTYTDPENDPVGSEEWEYIYDASVFGEIECDEEKIVQETPITMFKNAGAYEISHKVSDNPAKGNAFLESYVQWSDNDEYKKLILSQHRPRAEVRVTTTQSPQNSNICMVNAVYESEDADHPGDERKGIRDEKFYYKEIGDTDWTEGRFPANVSMGTTYLIKYIVKDIEGTVSRPAVAAVKTSESRQYAEPDDKNPPKVNLAVSSLNAEAKDVIYIEASAEDDYGINEFSLKCNGEEISKSYGRFEYKTETAGELIITAKATDIGGNETIKEETVNVIDKSDVTPPTIDITSPANGAVSGNTDIAGTIKDNCELKSYTVTMEKVTDTSEAGTEKTVLASGNEEIINDVITTVDADAFETGVYKIDIVAEDMSGLTSKVSIFITVQQEEYDDIVPQAEIKEIYLDEENKDIVISGTVTDETLFGRYELTVSDEKNQSVKTVISSGTEGKLNEVLGTIDTEELESGTYRLLLSAWDAEGNCCMAGASFTYEKGSETEQENIGRNEDVNPPVIAGELTAKITGEGLNLKLTGTITDESIESYKVVTGKPDEAGNITSPVIIAQGTESITESEIAEYTYPEYEEGQYIVEITATDNTGNVRKTYYIITITADGSIKDDYKGEIGEGDTENKKLQMILSTSSAATKEAIDIYLTYPLEAENVSITAPGATVTVNGRTAKITSDTPGEIEVTLSVTINGEEKSVSQTVRFVDETDTLHPEAYFLLPESDSEIKTKTQITGSVYDETSLAYYTLEYRMEGTGEYTEISKGTEPVRGGILGELDTTRLLNGRYTLRLTAADNGGHRTRVERSINVAGNLKVGNLNISFNDINANVSGIPLTVNRSYDSRNKASSDFGTGWSLGVQSAKLIKSSDITQGYEMVQTGDRLATGYYMTQTQNHDITVIYGDGTSDRFELKVSPERQALVPIYEVKVTFECITDENVKLELDGSNNALVYGSRLVFEDMDMIDKQSFILTKKDGTKLYLNEAYGLLKMEDSNGNAISITKNGYKHTDGNSVIFTRDSQGRITKAEEKDREGFIISSMSYAYDGKDNLITVTDKAGRTVTYTYDDEHNLIDIIDPSGIAIARNEYDEDGRLIAVTDADGNRMEYEHDIDGKTEIVRDKLGNTTVYTYDDNGNVLQTVDALGNKTTNTYDENNNLLTSKDAMGNVTEYSYDEKDNLVKKTGYNGKTTVFSYNDNNQVNSVSVLDTTKISINYDENGNAKSLTDANGNSTIYEYENNGNVKSISDELGLYKSYTYNEDGRLISIVDGNGNIINYTYDKKGYLISESQLQTINNQTESLITRYVNDESGNVLQEIAEDGSITYNEYDVNDRITAKIDSKNRRTEYTYYNTGNLKEIKYSDGTADKFEYDANGNTKKVICKNGIVCDMEYDKLGRLISNVYSNGTEEHFEYDANGNMLKNISTSGNITLYEYDGFNRNTSITDAYGNKTEFAYDDNSNLASVTDAKGNKTRYEYDNNGNQVKIIYPDNTEITMEYDARNQIISKSNAYDVTTSYQYDGIGNLTEVINSYGKSTRYEYDELGNITKITDANGNVTEYEYNSKERYKTVTNALGNESIYLYDTLGNVIWYKDYSGNVITYTYDENNNLSSETSENEVIHYNYDSQNQLIKVEDKNGITTYAYDDFGRILEKHTPDGSSFEYEYDSKNRLSSKILKINGNLYDKTAYEYDLMDRITRVVDRNGKATVYEYDEIGNRSVLKYANGVSVNYTYDACSRLTQETVKDKNNVLLYSYNYIYGKNGEILKIEEDDGENHTSKEYMYDTEEHLICEEIYNTSGNIINEYEYDNVGNRISKNTTISGDISNFVTDDSAECNISAGKTNYVYNALNQLISEECDGKTVNYEYDLNGNLIKQSSSTGEKIYTYNHKNQLVSSSLYVDDQLVKSEAYNYDFDGNRIEKTSGLETIKYIVDTSESLSEIAAEINELTDEITIYHRGLELEYIEKNNIVCYYVYDGHNDVRALIDDNNVIKSEYSYDAYGSLLEKETEVENNYLYNSQYYDDFTGLYYLRARYYNPQNGVFISLDTYEGDITQPITLHKYLYANANPVSNCDPSGNMAVALMGMTTGLNVESVKRDAYIMSIGVMMLYKLKSLIATTNAISNTYYMVNVIVEGVDWLTVSVDDAYEDIKAYVEKEIEKSALKRREDDNIYTVYTLADEEKNVQYVGRTKDYDRRIKEHKSKGGVMQKYELKEKDRYDKLTYEVCRGLEQALMVYYHTRKWFDGKGHNQVNGISNKNGKKELYYVDTIGYIENQRDNELLNLKEDILGDWWR